MTHRTMPMEQKKRIKALLIIVTMTIIITTMIALTSTMQSRADSEDPYREYYNKQITVENKDIEHASYTTVLVESTSNPELGQVYCIEQYVHNLNGTGTGVNIEGTIRGRYKNKTWTKDDVKRVALGIDYINNNVSDATGKKDLAQAWTWVVSEEDGIASINECARRYGHSFTDGDIDNYVNANKDSVIAYGMRISRPDGHQNSAVFKLIKSYKLSATTVAQAPVSMVAGQSSNPVRDRIITTITDSNDTIAKKDTVSVDITLHYEGFGTNQGQTVTKTMTMTPGTTADSPEFTPSDFTFTNWKGETEAWRAWGQGTYYFTVNINKQGNMKDAVSLNNKVDSETFTVTRPVEPPENKQLYDETNQRVVDETTEQLVYDMTYYARITAEAYGSNDLWIRDVIDTTNVIVDNDNAYVTDSDGNKIDNVTITTTQENNQTITEAHINSTVQPGQQYTLNIPQRPGKATEKWIIKDTPGYKYTPTDQYTDFGPHELPVLPPTPNKVWVLNEQGALTAQDQDWTNNINDITKGHADTKTFLQGDTIGAVVNGKIRKELVDNLKSYSITDDVTGSTRYITWDVSKTKVFIDGKDQTTKFTIARTGNKITATAKSELLKTTQLNKADHEVKLYITGTITSVGDTGTTAKLVNDAIENVNGQEAKTNEPPVFVWTPNPDKAWIKHNKTTNKWIAVIDPAKSNQAKDKDDNVSGDDQTFLDGDAVGSVVNGEIPANLATAPTKLVLEDDWRASDYLVDPDAISGVKIYTVDVDDTSKSTVTDIANGTTGTDVTKYFTLAYNSTDPTKATKITATAKAEYLKTLVNLTKGKQITMVIPMHANYAHGKGAAQVRKDYGVSDGDEVIMTNKADGSKFSNIASETIGGTTVKTNIPWIHGYVPPVKKNVLSAADQGGDQSDINDKNVEPGEQIEYNLTTEPKLPSSLSYDIEKVTITDKYDELFTPKKQTIEVTNLNTGRIVPRKSYKITWDDDNQTFVLDITDKNLLAEWKNSGAPRLMIRLEGTVAKEEDIPESRKETDGRVTITNQWFLRLNNSITPSNKPIVHVPPFNPVKADTQSKEQGNPKIDINGKTFLLGDTGEYRLTLDATDLKNSAYSVWRLGLTDDYDSEYLTADEKNVAVLDQAGKDVTSKFNVQIKDGVLYVFAKLVDTTVPSTQETIKATQPDDLRAYSESDEHNVETDPSIDQSLLGQSYTIVMPYKVTKVTDGYVVENVATQITDDRRKQTNVVNNPLHVLEPEKDVTITVGGDSVDGQEVALNSFFNYKLSSSTIPANRAYQEVTDWGISDTLDEKYDKYTGQWIVRAVKDVYGTDGNILFKAGDTIAESVGYHNANEQAKKAEDATTADEDTSNKTETDKTDTDNSKSDSDSKGKNAGTNASSDDKDTKGTDESKNNTKDDYDVTENETTTKELTLAEKTVTYGENPYFTATYENGTYNIQATPALLKLVSADTKHEYAFETYIQCERTWVTERHENYFAENYNGKTTDSNIVWTSTPENPAIDVEKYDKSSGESDGDRDEESQSLTVTGDTVIGFKVTNTGDVPLVNVKLTDETVDGTGIVKDIKFDSDFDGTLDPGESVYATGTLTGVEAGSTHKDTATVTGESYYTGKQARDTDDWFGHADPIPQTGDSVATVAGIVSVLGMIAGGVHLARKRMVA